MSGRRTLIKALLLGVLGVPFRAGSQATQKVHRIGLLLPNTPEIVARNPRIAAFLQGLRDYGLIEGKNLVIERRFAAGQLGVLDELAIDLVRSRVQVIVTAAAPSAIAAKKATATIPIVVLDPGDPVGLNLVTSLARPGGNVTGVTSIAPELASKRLALFKEAVPSVGRVAVLFNAAIPPAEIAITEIGTASRLLGLEIHSVAVRGAKGFMDAFSEMTRVKVDGFIVFPDPLTFSNQDTIAEMAMIHRLPCLAGASEFTEAGVLMSYGPKYQDMFRRGGYYVDRILKGTKPAELPVEQPTTFELLVNARTAKRLGIAIPRSILVRADKVIE